MTPPYLVTKSQKSVGIAILLTFAFGPIGLFYASISGGIIMTLTPILLAILVVVGLFQNNTLLLGWSLGLLVIFAATYWLINIIWAVISVRSYNKEIEYEAKKQFDLWSRSRETTPNQLVVNINQKTSDVNAERDTIEITTKPNLQDWLRKNPGKTINDYFSKFNR